MVENVLTEFSFQGEQREGESFYRAALNPEEQDKDALKVKFIGYSREWIRLTNFKLRQI